MTVTASRCTEYRPVLNQLDPAECVRFLVLEARMLVDSGSALYPGELPGTDTPI